CPDDANESLRLESIAQDFARIRLPSDRAQFHRDAALWVAILRRHDIFPKEGDRRSRPRLSSIRADRTRDTVSQRHTVPKGPRASGGPGVSADARDCVGRVEESDRKRTR